MINPIRESNPSDEYLLEILNEYAVDVLRQEDWEVGESLKRRQIPMSQLRPLGESYQISLNLGQNFAVNSIREILQEQIKAVALFIRDFQIGVLGQRMSLFHLYEIELKLNNSLRYDLTFESGKLVIHIPYWQAIVLKRYLTYNEIKYYWERGLHLAKSSPSRNFWWLLNPIGEFRSNLRSMLLLAIQRQIEKIDKFFVKFGLMDDESKKSLLAGDDIVKSTKVKDSAIAFLKANTNRDKLGVNLDALLKDKDEATLLQLMGVFKKNLADAAQMEELIDAGSLTLQEEIQDEQSQVDVKMFGFVNVGNYHRIDLSLNVSAGYLKKYVDIIPRNTDVKAVQWGFVNIYRIDDITVKPNFHGAVTLNFETAALERALKELELLE
ncbi:hypothetical protein [Limnofasciculus baicalensis]|uniref:Uncharacterized protein n=1 Tax=Limnofasciculus baicalensis BBK-W-15 TaxID=2699891 RepID=A0AAE3GWS0_9CYAN|nr:hypothetical protein [Limnofasciculus baicalensis]MCP2732131.1 hypothetical protein [Limnofasciculus baicalensis BBK-W-15]